MLWKRTTSFVGDPPRIGGISSMVFRNFPPKPTFFAHHGNQMLVHGRSSPSPRHDGLTNFESGILWVVVAMRIALWALHKATKACSTSARREQATKSTPRRTGSKILQVRVNNIPVPPSSPLYRLAWRFTHFWLRFACQILERATDLILDGTKNRPSNTNKKTSEHRKKSRDKEEKQTGHTVMVIAGALLIALDELFEDELGARMPQTEEPTWIRSLFGAIVEGAILGLIVGAF